MAPSKDTGRSLFYARLMALPDELQALIISFIVSRTNRRISLTSFVRHARAICLPLKHNNHLHTIAHEQVLRANTFYWPVTCPSITPFATVHEIRYLDIDLSIIIGGGNVNQPSTFDLSEMDVAKMIAVPYYCPELETLTINVENTVRIYHGSWYVDHKGGPIPAAAYPEGITTERCWKMGEIVRRVKEMQFLCWRRNLKVQKKIVFIQSAGSRIVGVFPDPTTAPTPTAYAEAMCKILDCPVAKVDL